MKTSRPESLSRRAMLAGLATATLGISSGTGLAQTLGAPSLRRNASGFRTHRWEDYFETRQGGVILCDTAARYVSYWSEDGTIHRVYPSSVPQTEELTRLGRTEVIRKVEGPSWRPTPSMKERNPEWPDYWPPGPDNPLGTHALYLSWQYYRVHGTGDTRKIGRKSSNGCIGLYNEQIAELFGMAKVGTQVVLI